MGVKAHHGKFEVTLHGRYVGMYADESDAKDVFGAGRRLVTLGKPLDVVVDELRGRVPQSSAPMLSAYYDAWAALLTFDADSETPDRYGINFRRLPKWLRDMRIDLIGTDEVKSAVKEMTERGLAPKSIIESAHVLRSVLHAAVDARIIDRNPAAKIRNLPANERKREPRVLERHEYPLVVAAAPWWARNMVEVWPLLGLRAGEMVALRKAAVEFDQHRVYVGTQRTVKRVTKAPKKGSVGYVDLTPTAERILRRQFEQVPDSPFVFVNSVGRQVSRSCLRDSIFQPISKTVGFLLRPHDMRHTAGSWLIKSGADLAYVQHFLRHKDPAITARTYVHELQERDATSVGRFDMWVGGGEETGKAKEGEGETPSANCANSEKPSIEGDSYYYDI